MDKYEYSLKVDQIKSLCAEESYELAAEIADSINWNKVKNANILVKVGEVYEKAERLDDAQEILLMAYDRSPIGRMIIYHLAEVAIKMNDYESASEYYEEFVKIAPHDTLKYVLKYSIRKALGATPDELISILEEFKEQEYMEEWAYELAFLYHSTGKVQKCVEACDELILWFGDGPYVENALELKMLYQPLSKAQEEKYRQFKIERGGFVSFGEIASENNGEGVLAEDINLPPVEDTTEPVDIGSLQQEVAKGIEDIKNASELDEISESIYNIKKMVNDIPVLQITKDDKDGKSHIATSAEIDGALKSNFRQLLKEESDGQMTMMMDEQILEDEQISGQMSIQDILDDWEKTRKAAEAALHDADQQKFQSVKARALQEADNILNRINDVKPKLDAGLSPKEVLEEEYMQGAEPEELKFEIRMPKKPKEVGKMKKATKFLNRQIADPKSKVPGIVPVGTGNAENDLMAALHSGYEAVRIHSKTGIDFLDGTLSRHETKFGVGEPQQYAESVQYEEEPQQYEELVQYEEPIQSASSDYGEIQYSEYMEMAKKAQNEKLPKPEDTPATSSLEEEMQVLRNAEIGLEEAEEQLHAMESAIMDMSLEQEQVPKVREIKGVYDKVEEPEKEAEDEDVKIYKMGEFFSGNADEFNRAIIESSLAIEQEDVQVYKEQQVQEIPEEIPEDIPEDILEEISEETSEEISQEEQVTSMNFGELEIPEVNIDLSELAEYANDLETDNTDGPEETQMSSSQSQMDQVEEVGQTIMEEEIVHEQEESDEQNVEPEVEKMSDLNEKTIKSQMKEIVDDSEELSPEYNKDITYQKLKAFSDEAELQNMKLTKEQKEVFAYFIPVKGMEHQISKALSGVSKKLANKENGATGHLIIQGVPGCGKTLLATSFVKVLQLEKGNIIGKIGKINATQITDEDVEVVLERVSGGCLIIEGAGEMDEATATAIAKTMKKDKSGLLLILEDTSKGIRKALHLDQEFAGLFTEKIAVPIFTNDELVAFARAYSNELGYKIDELAVLALYNRISGIQKLNQATTLSEVKEIVDEAIDREAHGGLKKAISILTAKRYTEDDKIVLTERTFN